MTKQFLKQTLTMITAAFGVVAALAWNSAIQALIAKLFPAQTAGVRSAFVYALLITVVTVFVTYSVGQVDARLEDPKSKSNK